MSDATQTRADTPAPEEHEHALKANGVSSAGAVVMATGGLSLPFKMPF